MKTALLVLDVKETFLQNLENRDDFGVWETAQTPQVFRKLRGF